jgi:hypothetical protein
VRHLSSPAPISRSIAALVFFGDIVVLLHGSKALFDYVMGTCGFCSNALGCVVCHSIHWPNKNGLCTPHSPLHGLLLLLADRQHLRSLRTAGMAAPCPGMVFAIQMLDMQYREDGAAEPVRVYSAAP